MIIQIDTKFPLEWGKTYYVVGTREASVFAPCPACDSTGKVSIKDETYTCPRCRGRRTTTTIVGKKTVYGTEKYELSGIEIRPRGTLLWFRCIHGTRNHILTVSDESFDTMRGENRQIYDDYREALAEVRRLNAGQ